MFQYFQKTIKTKKEMKDILFLSTVSKSKIVGTRLMLLAFLLNFLFLLCEATLINGKHLSVGPSSVSSL